MDGEQIIGTTEDLHKAMTTVTSHSTHLIILNFNVFVSLIKVLLRLPLVTKTFHNCTQYSYI